MKLKIVGLLVLFCSCLAANGQSASLKPQFNTVGIAAGGQFQNGVFVTFNDSTLNSVGLTVVVGCPSGATCTLMAFPQTPNAGLIGAKYPTSAGEAVLIQTGTAALGSYPITVVGIAQPSLAVLTETFTLNVQ